MRPRRSELAQRFRAPVAIRGITPAEVQVRLSFRLRQIIGPGRRATLEEAARLTGINARTLKAYVAGRACPNVARYGRLLRAFGPEVGIELALMLGWQPRASNPALPHTEELRALRDAVAQTIRQIDLVLAHGGPARTAAIGPARSAGVTPSAAARAPASRRARR